MTIPFLNLTSHDFLLSCAPLAGPKSALVSKKYGLESEKGKVGHRLDEDSGKWVIFAEILTSMLYFNIEHKFLFVKWGVLSLTICRLVLQFMQRLIGDKKVVGITFKFNQAKAIEVILYLVQKVSVPNIYGICKLLYLVDKVSLEKYGRFLFGESYVAMKEGGTPSNVYDLLKRLRQRPTSELKIEGNSIVALRQAELDYLSKSDLACLDEIISKYGKVANWSDRRKESHDNAWQRAWDKRGTKNSVRITVESIAEMFQDSDDLVDYLLNSG